MKALRILKEIKVDDLGLGLDLNPLCVTDDVCQAIEEIEAYITNYQGIKRRLDNTVITLAVLQNENKSLVKTLEKYNEEMIELRKENQELLNTVIEAQEVIKDVLEGRK